MPDDVRLPIRVVVTGQKDLVKPRGGGGGRKTFGEASPEFRKHVIGQLENVKTHFAATFAEQPISAVAKLTLKQEALAKSHRPIGLLQNTCPIIGVGRIGQLLISVRPDGIERLQERIQTVSTKSGEADLTTIETIQPYTLEDTLGGTADVGSLQKELQQSRALKLKLFRHHDSARDDEVQTAFSALAGSLGLEPQRLPYSSDVSIYKIQSDNLDTAEPLAKFVGTETLSPIPTYGLLENASTAVRTVSPGEFPYHSALLRSRGVSSEDLRYRGFGVPGDLTDIITCAQWQATLIFEPELVSGLEFARDDFPIPDSLRTTDGKVKGEFFITLSYDPPLNASSGAEYCRTNVDVSLGSYDVGKDGKRHHQRRIPPEPQDLSELFEKHLIEHGFKWSPNKVYHRLITRGIAGDVWRLHVSATHRAGFQATNSISAVVIVTMVDPDRKGQVYDETVILMDRLGWKSDNLTVAEKIRLQS